MTDYAIIQLAEVLAPAIALLGLGGLGVSLVAILRGRSGRKTRAALDEINTRLARLEAAVGAGETKPSIAAQEAEIRRRIETLETIVVDRELEGPSKRT